MRIGVHANKPDYVITVINGDPIGTLSTKDHDIFSRWCVKGQCILKTFFINNGPYLNVNQKVHILAYV